MTCLLLPSCLWLQAADGALGGAAVRADASCVPRSIAPATTATAPTTMPLRCIFPLPRIVLVVRGRILSQPRWAAWGEPVSILWRSGIRPAPRAYTDGDGRRRLDLVPVVVAGARGAPAARMARCRAPRGG